MKFKPYPKYKASGLEWLGHVPEGWQILPLFTVLNERQTKNEGNQVQNVLSLSYGRIVDRDVESNHGLLPESFETYQIVAQNDVILRLTDLQNDQRSLRVGQVRRKGIITSAYVCLVPSDRVEPTYAYLLLHAYDTLKIFYGLGGGVRQTMKFADLKRLPLAIPPKNEQVALTSFLDRETAKIDTLIAKQEQLIDLLKEKRQAVISHAIGAATGSVSARLRHYVDLLPGYAFASSEYSQDAQNMRLLRGINVGVGRIRWDETVYWPSENLMQMETFSLQVGDILFGMDRPWISEGARIAVVTKDDVPSLLVQRVCRLRSSPGMTQDFLSLVLSSNEFRDFVEVDLTGVSVPHISPDQILSFQANIPGVERQLELCRRVQSQFSKIDTLVAKAQQAISLQKEHRTALIAAAVRGKIDVRNELEERKAA